MNASFQSSVTGSARPAAQGGTYAPSVPISVYRELANELRTSQARVESLTQHNQQLHRQNQALRQEMLRFVEAAGQMKQTLVAQPPLPDSPPLPLSNLVEPLGPELAPPGEPAPDEGTRLGAIAQQMNQLMAAAPKPSSPAPNPARAAANERKLYTEERLQPSRSSQRSAPADLSGLWLATTILLVVFSAFGAGFLIMKPLLNTGR